MRRLGLSLSLLLIVGCVAETPQEERGFYKNEPVVFSAPYDDVWSAALRAVEELNWNTKNVYKKQSENVLREQFW